MHLKVGTFSSSLLCHRRGRLIKQQQQALVPSIKNFWYLDMELRTFCCVCKLTRQNSNDWLKKKQSKKEKNKSKQKNVLLSKPAFLLLLAKLFMTLKKNTSYAISLCVLESLQKNYSWSFYFHHAGSASLYLRSRAERKSLQVSEGTITFFTLFLIICSLSR